MIHDHTQTEPTASSPPRKAIKIKRVLEKLGFGKSTLNAKLQVGGKYWDKSFPCPFYLPHSRIRRWWESEIDAWLTAAESSSRLNSPSAAQRAFPNQAHRQVETKNGPENSSFTFGRDFGNF